MADPSDLIRALRATMGKLEIALSSISDALGWTGADGRIQWCNSALARLVGKTHLEVLGVRLINLLPLEHEGQALGPAVHPVNLALGGRSPHLGSYEFQRGDRRLCLEVSCTRVSLVPNQVTVVFVIRDVTERIQAEQKIVESENELREYIDHMSTLSAKVAPDGTLLLVNRIAEHASGLPQDLLMKTNFLEGPWWAFDSEVQSRVRKAFQRAVSGETVNYDERLFVFGRTLTINFSLVPVRDSKDEVVYIVAEGRDITAQKQAEDKLQIANLELEAFSYSVSHDLQAPLRAIDGFSKELLENCVNRLDEQGKGDLKRIRGAAHRMSQLIDDLLKLSRLSRSEMTYEEVDLSAQVEKIAEDLKTAHSHRRVEFIIEPKLVARGDPRLLMIALENLVGNAWKFTEKRPQAVIKFGTTDQGGKAFFIEDNGVGFDMAYAGKLFRVFQRLHDAQEYAGTGIGLVTVHRIIDRHGGRIWVKAEENRGATFYFTLP